MLGDTLSNLGGPIFVTGHTGFKGSWLNLLLSRLRIESFGYSLSAERNSLYERAKLEEISKGNIGDIRDFENLSRALRQVRPSVIIHLAAQSLVLKSFEEPLETFQINCMGTANILKAAFETNSVKAVLVITSDKVYRNNETGQQFMESDPLGGKDPYSASKVAAESVSSAWQHISEISGGPKILVARAGNVIGGGDFGRNRLIPDIIKAVVSGKELVIRNPSATRPWQHVLDPLVGYLEYLEHFFQGYDCRPALNFGPQGQSLRVEKVLEIAKLHFDQKLQVRYAKNVVSIESSRLDLDSTAARQSLSWRPRWNQEESIHQTFAWWTKVLYENSVARTECMDEIESSLNNL